MNDDERLLDELGRLERDGSAVSDRRLDDRWRRLVDGTISGEDDAELRAAARESADARFDYETFRPLGPEFRQQMVERLQERTERTARAKPLPFKPRGQRRSVPYRRWAWGLAAALAVAVVGGAVILRLSEAVLPAFYAVELGEPVVPIRSTASTEAGLPQFAVGGRFELVLRPTRTLESDLDVAFYLESESGQLEPWRPQMQKRRGAVKIEGSIGQDVDLRPGTWTLWIVYGHAGKLPSDLSPDAELPEASRHWRILRQRFMIIDPVRGGGSAAGVAAPAQVEYAGCFHLLPGPLCVSFAKLTIWVAAGLDDTVEIRLDGQAIDLSGIPVHGGLRYTLEPGPGRHALEVRSSSRTRWELKLDQRQAPAWVKHSETLETQGRLAAALAALEPWRGSRGRQLDRALAHSKTARILLLRNAGEAEITAHLSEAMEIYRRESEIVGLGRDVGMQFFLDSRHSRLDAARRLLRDLEEALPRPGPAEPRLTLLYNQAVLYRKSGDYRRALQAQRQALDLALRVGDTAKRVIAEEQIALLLHDLGRTREAVELLLGLRRAVERPLCEDVRFLNNLGWVLTLACDRELGDPISLLEHVVKVSGHESCGGVRRLNALINLAYAYVVDGRPEEAAKADEVVAEAESLNDAATPYQRLWWTHLKGLRSIQKGDLDAAEDQFAETARLAEEIFFPEGQWLAKVGLARAFLARGGAAGIRTARALLEDAEELLGEESLQVPLHQDRGMFVAKREEGTRLLLDLLLRQGLTPAALEVARRSRARVLKSVRRGYQLAHLSPRQQDAVDQALGDYHRLRQQIEDLAADRWTRTAEELEHAESRHDSLQDEARKALDAMLQALPHERASSRLAPIRPGELLLLYHPLPTGWIAFAATPQRIETHTFQLSEDLLSQPAELARRLLEPFDDLIVRAARVRVLPFGLLREVDFHALPWGGDILLRTASVVYGLDLEPRRPAAGRRRALVLGDPRGNLPNARREAEQVHELLSRGGWEVELLVDSEVTATAVRDRLGAVDLLHYAGHSIGRRDQDAESVLLLAADSHLTVGDVLATDRVPAWVVLSSCEAARPVSQAPAAGLAMAQAFLVAGSERVIAAVRPVDDRATAELFRIFYDSWDQPSEMTERFHAAQLSWYDEPSNVRSWASFRVFEP